MASRSLSPGGALLRASRIFSIPPPLPRPAGELSSIAIFNSDTSTAPHPTHQAITTPQASRSRGDWGFKRPLPLRSTTKTSTPLIRVEAIDTFEHITEFGSSADHTLTLRKFEELDLPLTAPPPRQTTNLLAEHQPGVGIFEDDATAEFGAGGRGKDDVRWKFKGPWVAGQNEGEFKEYLTKEVRKRKGEFHSFLRGSCATSLTKEAQRIALDEGEEATMVRLEDVSDAQLTNYIKNLRKDLAELYKQIRDFLDLPPAPLPKIDTSEAVMSWLDTSKEKLGIGADVHQLPVSNSPFAAHGPPKTHPSAGLSYLRTASYINNHPEFGPQKEKTPVMGRVVMPKNAATGSFNPVLGVAGFAVAAEARSFQITGGRGKPQHGIQRKTIPGLISIEPEKIGGSKIHLNTLSASVDAQGKVLMVVDVAEPEAIAVKEGTTNELPQPTTLPPRGPDYRGSKFTRRLEKPGGGSYGMRPF